MIAKVVELRQNIEVIVKKVIVNDNFGITLNFIAEMEDKSQTNITLTMEYDFEDSRNKVFDELTFHNLNETAKQLEGFKHILNERDKS